MKKVMLLVLAVLFPLAASAGTTKIDTASLPHKEVNDVAKLTPLVLTAEKTPAVVLLRLEAGDVVPPHATKSGMRILTVLTGDMSWGDGEAIDEAKETLYPAGTVLTIPAGVSHWLAARSDDVVVQLVVLDDETLVPAVQEQMK